MYVPHDPDVIKTRDQDRRGIFFGVKGGLLARKADTLDAICEPTV
jgi:hypothetical protein